MDKLSNYRYFIQLVLLTEINRLNSEGHKWRHQNWDKVVSQTNKLVFHFQQTISIADQSRSLFNRVVILTLTGNNKIGSYNTHHGKTEHNVCLTLGAIFSICAERNLTASGDSFTGGTSFGKLLLLPAHASFQSWKMLSITSDIYWKRSKPLSHPSSSVEHAGTHVPKQANPNRDIY